MLGESINSGRNNRTTRRAQSSFHCDEPRRYTQASATWDCRRGYDFVGVVVNYDFIDLHSISHMH